MKHNFFLLIILFLNYIQCKKETYDFIIIGGGTAGTVLAKRLAENATLKILLIEAGPEPPLIQRIPSLAPIIQNSFNWNLFATDPTLFQAYNQNSIPIPIAKLLGGCSANNFMIYSRGHPNDFNWSKKWQWTSALKYFLKSEKASLTKYIDRKFHNESGLISVEHGAASQYSNTFFDALKEKGYNFTDYNGKSQIGFSPVQATMENGVRFDLAQAYLQNHPANLTLLLNAHVTRLLFNAKQTRVKAVEYVSERKTFKISARQEVILCAGAINTPKLLKLSGIGPETELKSLNISVVKQMEHVGANLGDHLIYPGLQFISKSFTNNPLLNFFIDLPNLFVPLAKKPVPSFGFDSIAFISADDSSTKPDIQFLLAVHGINQLFKKTLNLKDDFFDQFYKPIQSNVLFSIYPILLNAKSRGTVKLQSPNPLEPPLVQLNYFTHPNDLPLLIEGIKFALNLTQTRPFQNISAILNPAKVPTCEQFLNDDDYWSCALKSLTMSTYDFYGTAQMGNSASTSVVNDRLQVHNITNLRIVDASVIPDNISGNLMASVVMIAEKAADLIKSRLK